MKIEDIDVGSGGRCGWGLSKITNRDSVISIKRNLVY